MDGFMIFCWVILVIGFILLVGSFVFLCIGKVANSTGDNKIEFQGPAGLKFSTNIPLVFTLFLGAGLIAYPLSEFRKYKESQPPPLTSARLKMIPVTCKVDYQGSKTLTIYASIAQDNIVNGEGTLQIPVIPNALYTAIGFKDSGEPYARKRFTLTGEEHDYSLDFVGSGGSSAEGAPPPPLLRTTANAQQYQLPQTSAGPGGGQ